MADLDQPLRILIVEDEKLIREDVKYILEHFLGLPVVVDQAENGLEGWEKIAAQRYDLVITDQTMPGMTGLSLVEKIRRHPAFNDLKIIAFSANEDLRKAFLGLGADAFIDKPCSTDHLVNIVKDVIKPSTPAIDFSQTKILIVDDYESIRVAFIRALAAEGIFKRENITSVPDGKAALDLVLRTHFDVILTDTNMPQMNGIELTRAIRAASTIKQPKILGMSGDDRPAAQFAQAGANGFMVKTDPRQPVGKMIQDVLTSGSSLLLPQYEAQS